MLSENGAKLRFYWLIGAFILSLVSYYFLLFQTDRHDFFRVLLFFAVLSAVYLMVLKMSNLETLQWTIGAAILMRVALLGVIPELSDDFYRFIWDGRLLSEGISPFAAIPSKLMENPEFRELPINKSLYEGMNSPDYFTIYPPIAQWIFVTASWVFPDKIISNLMVMRSFILLAEVGSILLIVRLLKQYGLAGKQVLIYAWNPLVIIELTGNLHFEAIMIFFLLLAIYLLNIKYWKWSAVAISASVAAKLIPLMFLPLLMFRMPIKKLMIYWVLCGTVVLAFFLSVWSPALVDSMHSSLSLYFQKFEFNASVYYLVREIGYAVKGYNIIQTSGKLLPMITLGLILIFSWYSHKRLSWPQAMLWVLTLYLFMSTTVHPWYVTPLIALCVFTDYKYPIAWSILVVLTYSGYSETGFKENMVLVFLEYTLVILVLVWDLLRERIQARMDHLKLTTH